MCQPTSARLQDIHQVGIGMFGLGVVGSSVYQILSEQRGRLGVELGVSLSIQRVVIRDPYKTRSVPVTPDLLAIDPGAVLDDPEIGVVVEVMGGVEPARTHILTALRRGKSVVTANKELMAGYGQELLATAAEHGVDLYFEASVGGGIPVLRPLRQTLSAGRLRRIMGIVNGTTNYVLDRMTRGGQTLATALAEAQAKGYAEPDPSADITGVDAARKLAILAGLAFHLLIPVPEVDTEGITQVAPEDIAYGADRGWVVKLIACAERNGETVTAWVAPAFLPNSHPLAGVGDAFNAIFVHGAEVGECMFYGRGAGGPPTASAVIGDILTVAAHRRRGYSDSRAWSRRPAGFRSAEEVPACYYLRVMAGEPGSAACGTAPGAPMVAGRFQPAVQAETVRPEAIAVALARAGVPVVSHQTHPLWLAVETGPVLWSTVRAALDQLRAIAVLGSAIRLLT